MASKIVVVGDINGQFPAVFSKLAALHSKNAFAFCIVAGSLFADPQTATPSDESNIASLLRGDIRVSLPTYFALGAHALPASVIDRLEQNAGELCENLYFLGKRTTIKTSEGLRVVALGGSLDPNIVAGASKDKYPPFYSEDDARALKGAHSADVLVTSQWPAGIRTRSKVDFSVPDDEPRPAEQPCVADLCSALKPRYHFSTSPNAFYEREPFFHIEKEETDGFSITRFISLAAFGNPGKQKWIYAFSLDPSAAPPVAVPAGTTASPLASTGKKRSHPQPDHGPSYRFSTDHHHGHNDRPRKKQRAPAPMPSECFFCLSNPNLATHLITSIGNDAYLTTAKGPLTTATTFPQLQCPSHILIIPLTHDPTLASITDTVLRATTRREMHRYRRALQATVASAHRNSSGEELLAAVTWQVSRSAGVHAHWQFLPVPLPLVQKGVVEAAFKVEAENESYPRFERKARKLKSSYDKESSTKDADDDEADGGEEEEPAGDFFRATIWCPPSSISGSSGEGGSGGGGTEIILTLPLDSSIRFNLQFGRRVLAKLLGLEERMQWQDCGQDREEEERDAEAFKKAFKAWDFSVEEEER